MKFNDADDLIIGSSYPSHAMLNNEVVWIRSGSEDFSTPGTYSWIVPSGVYEVTLCMIGAGGSGSRVNSGGSNVNLGGGHRGTIYSDTETVTPGDTITVVVGLGPTTPNATSSPRNGVAGGLSSFGTIVANGGAGGNTSGNYPGNGAVAPENCIGIFNDGTLNTGGGININAYGGQAGFGDGQRGYVSSATTTGSGGGGSSYNGINAGGNGQVKISWGS